VHTKNAVVLSTVNLAGEVSKNKHKVVKCGVKNTVMCSGLVHISIQHSDEKVNL